MRIIETTSDRLVLENDARKTRKWALGIGVALILGALGLIIAGGDYVLIGLIVGAVGGGIAYMALTVEYRRATFARPDGTVTLFVEKSLPPSKGETVIPLADITGLATERTVERTYRGRDAQDMQSSFANPDTTLVAVKLRMADGALHLLAGKQGPDGAGAICTAVGTWLGISTTPEPLMPEPLVPPSG
ncbi:MAG: hypothetical protein AAF899_07825 [Pseudomonadota bacterium]